MKQLTCAKNLSFFHFATETPLCKQHFFFRSPPYSLFSPIIITHAHTLSLTPSHPHTHCDPPTHPAAPTPTSTETPLSKQQFFRPPRLRRGGIWHTAAHSTRLSGNAAATCRSVTRLLRGRVGMRCATAAVRTVPARLQRSGRVTAVLPCCRCAAVAPGCHTYALFAVLCCLIGCRVLCAGPPPQCSCHQLPLTSPTACGSVPTAAAPQCVTVGWSSCSGSARKKACLLSLFRHARPLHPSLPSPPPPNFPCYRPSPLTLLPQYAGRAAPLHAVPPLA